MLSTKEYGAVLEIIQLSCKFGMLPADWNSTYHWISSLQKKWKRTLVPVMLIYRGLYVIFILNRITMELKTGLGVERLPLHVLFLCAHSFATLYQWHVWESTTEICNLINHMASFRQNQGMELIRVGVIYTPSLFRKLLITLFIRCDSTILIAIASTAFLKPHNSNFVHSMFPSHYTAIYILFGLLESFLIFQIFLSANLVFVFVTYYVLTTRFWIRTVVDKINECRTKDASAAASMLKYYRMLLIMNDMYNRSWANLIVPSFKFILIGTVVSALYATLRFFGSIEIMVYVWCPMLVIFLVGIFTLLPPLFASVYERSIKIFGRRDTRAGKRENCFLLLNPVSNGSIGKSLELRILNRELVSCRPLKCKSGALYFFDREAGLTCLNLISQLTASFLLVGR